MLVYIAATATIHTNKLRPRSQLVFSVYVVLILYVIVTCSTAGLALFKGMMFSNDPFEHLKFIEMIHGLAFILQSSIHRFARKKLLFRHMHFLEKLFSIRIE